MWGLQTLSAKLQPREYKTMLEFFSAATRIVNTRRAVTECLENALGGTTGNCDLILIHSSLGHNFEEILAQTKRLAPKARVLAASCCGVISREGVGEDMKDIGLMAIRGTEFAVASVDGIYGHNSFEKCRRMVKELQQQRPNINMVYLMASGIDIATDRCIAAIESVMGEGVTVFGATSSDNMRGMVSYQGVDNQVFEHSAFIVGFADPSLECDTQATHGFSAVGSPLEVTQSEGQKIIELDGKPAWKKYTSLLGLSETVDCGKTIPVGAIAEQLSPEQASEYGNQHILRVITCREGNTMLYPTTCPTGTKLWLTTRDEDLIFRELDRMTATMVVRANGRKPVAVFHADCLARGRFLLNRVLKEELVSRMQHPFSTDGECPPWLGMYGFGEFARLGGVNTFHNYTTALSLLYRK